MTGPVVLLGRADELDTATAVLAAAAAGCGAVLVVEGEAGIGKTALVDAIAGLAHDRDLPVFRAAATEMERRRPYGVVRDVLDVREDAALRRQRASTGPLAADGDPDSWAGTQFRIGEQLLALVDELTRSQPALVVAEDLHWADPASLVVLGRLARTPVDAPVVLLATIRPAPRRPELHAMLDALPDTTLRLRLGPLPEADAVALAQRQTRAPLGPRLRAGLAAAGGNPLFVQEVMSGLLADGAVLLGASGTVDVSGDEVLPSMSSAILRHLSFLSPATTRLLGVAAVLGSSFSIGALGRLTNRPDAELRADLEEAVTGAVLVEQDADRFAFRHDLIHEVFYYDVAPAVRKALHSDAAAVLQQDGAGMSAVAEHVVRSAGAGGADAVALLRRAAAEAAATGAPGIATDLLKAAIEARSEDPALVAALRAELGVALVASGRYPEGERVLRDALAAGVSGGREAMVREALAQAILVQGRVQESFAEVEAAAIAPGLTAGERARFAARASMAAVFAGYWEAAPEAGRRAMAAAAAAGDVPAEIRAGLTLAHVDNQRGRWRAAREHTARAVALATAEPTLRANQSMPFHLHSGVLLELDEVEEALEAALTGLREAERHGIVDAIACGYFAVGAVHLWTGRWDDSVAANETGVRLADETGVAWQTEALCELALLHCWQGRRAVARSYLDRARAKVVAGAGQYRTGWVAGAAAVIAEADGRDDRALAELEAGWAAAVRVGAVIEYRHLGPPLARLAVAAGRPALAATIAEELEAVAAANPDVPALAATAARARGLAERDPRTLLDALEQHRPGVRIHDTARCAEELACVLALAGRADEAAPIAFEALEIYGRLGADGEASRARAVFQRAGLRLGVRGPRTRPTSGWSALTPTEAEVARHVAGQLSNPEIAQAMSLSRRTVAHHVSNVQAKLGMASRSQVMAAAELRDPVRD